MTRWTLAGCMALAALGAAAALDVGSRAAEAAPSVSPFAGSWSGVWDVLHHPEFFGTYDWTISDRGRMTGTVTNTPFARGGKIVGQVGADGSLNLTDYVPNDEPSTGVQGYHFKGTVVIEDDGKLVVSATDISGTLFLSAVLERY